MQNKLTKEERQAKKLERKQARSETLATLKRLQGKDILTMNLNQLQKIVKVLADNAGISQNGIIL